MPDKIKEKFKDTKVGGFLSDIAPELFKTGLSLASGFLPDGGLLEKLADKIKTSDEISSEQKVEALAFLTLDLKDLADARAMYKTTDHKMADTIANRIIKFNLPVIIGLVLANIAAVMLLDGKGEVIAIVSNFIGIAIGNLFNERQSVVNFFFGSSLGSKEKAQELRNNK